MLWIQTSVEGAPAQAAGLAAVPEFLGAQSTSSGKTTLLLALTGELDPRERVIVIEDTRELDPSGLPNCSRREACRGRADDGLPSVTVRRLVRHALRARPDRFFVRDVRGSEALDLLQALNTWPGGSLSTIHSPGARAVPCRPATGCPGTPCT